MSKRLYRRIQTRQTIILLIFMVGMSCNLPVRRSNQDHNPTIAAPSGGPSSATLTTSAPTLTPAAPSRPEYTCAYQPAIAAMLEETNADRWIAWISKLSGEETVEVDGQKTRIQTRYTPAMFSGSQNALAFEWVKQQVRAWYPEDQILEQPYPIESEGHTYEWKNLVLTLPGVLYPQEIVVLSAHLDSTSETPLESAPGAEDNGSGSAALLEAARLFRQRSFARTIQIVWFTGEEQGLRGSQAFTGDTDYNPIDLNQVVGVINLDMFGFDSDEDRCFELHVGDLPASQSLGECFTQTIQAYDLNLTYDYLTTTATSRSDHGSFWRSDIGAIEVLEDLFKSNLKNGCPANDPSPYYHTSQDVVANLNPETGISIVRAALATVAALAMPQEPPR